jgi:hypothetical protein
MIRRMEKSEVFSIWVLLNSNIMVKEIIKVRIIFSSKEILNKNIKKIIHTAVKKFF